MIVEEYLARLALAGYRPATLRARRFTLAALTRHLAPAPIEHATRAHVETWLARPLKPESRRAYRSHLRHFFAWLVDEGLCAEDPTVRLPPIRVPRGVPRPISDPDLSLALSRACPRQLYVQLDPVRSAEVVNLVRSP